MKNVLFTVISTICISSLLAQNVGIGTSGPAEKLDVVGNIKSSGETYWGNSGSRTQTRNDAGASGVGVRSGFYETSSPVNFPSGATGWWHLLDIRHSNIGNNHAMQITGSFGDQNLWFRKTANSATTAWSKIISSNDLNGTNNYISKFTSANSIGNSQLYDNGTNVGIGTSSPSQKLHVIGTGRFSSLASGSNGAFIRTNTSGDLAITNFTGNNTQVLRGDGSFGEVPKDYKYSLPNTGGTAQWVKLGTLNLTQQGKSAHIKVVTNSGYNANMSQNTEVYIRFKTSNVSSVDENGFAADASYYMEGRLAQFATSDRIKFVANAAGGSASSYELYMYFGTYTGSNSFYTVEVPGGTWEHSGTTGQTDPGAASSTVLIPLQEFNIRSNSLVVDATGNVGIGLNNPTYDLHVNGRIKSNGINETSDIRFKKDISNLENSLEKLVQLRGVSYYWKQDEYPERKFSDSKDLGLIAQEVEKIFPEVVDTDTEGYKSVQYSHLVPVLVEAIKAQQETLQNKENRIKLLESKLEAQAALFEQIDFEKLSQDYSTKVGQTP